MANTQRGNRRLRKRGDPSWYDRSMADNVSATQPDEAMGIPEDKVGLIIGKKGSRLQEIKEQSRAHVVVIDNKVHLRGTPEQCEKAKKIIGEILNSVSVEGSSWRKRGKFEKSNSLKSLSSDLVWLAISSREPDFLLASSKAGSIVPVNCYKYRPSMRLRMNCKWPGHVFLLPTKRKADSGDEIVCMVR